MLVLTHSVDETRALAEQIGRRVLRAGDLVMLAGDLGAGKTAFAQGVARGLDVTDAVVSPTFTIVREYEGRLPLTHVDVYRLERLQDLHDLGFDEFLDDGVTLVEWGDVVASLLPPDRLEVRLQFVSDDEREIELTPQGASWAARSVLIDDIVARV